MQISPPPSAAATRPKGSARLGSVAAHLLEAAGLRRPRTPDGELLPRRWGRLAAFGGAVVLVWILSTTIHIVSPGTVGVPVTLGRAGDALDPGLHITWPLTSTNEISVRTEQYTMASVGEGGRAGNDAVEVLGLDGAAGRVDSTVLFRVDPSQATAVYRRVGTNYVEKVIRPSARTCIRSSFTDYAMIDAATSSWHELEASVTDCMVAKLEARGLILEDFQLREVHLDDQIQSAIDAKVAAQQDSERQQFELSKAQQAADITRVDALATADAQQILACGGDIVTLERDGREVQVVVPRAIDDCDQAQLTPAYLQYTYIQALKQLVDSPNNSTIILPFDENLTPLLNIPDGSSDNTAATTTPRADGATETTTDQG